jgi:hypothetical protein
MHLSVVAAKDVVEAYYGQEIQYSYYDGCFTRGRQGLKEAQTFPDDFDGAVIGAPACWTVHRLLIHNQPGFHNPHDALLALVNWVENGTAPTEMIATKWNDEDTLDSVTRQRPICMYPQQAKYVGHGDPDIASSWKCRSGY